MELISDDDGNHFDLHTLKGNYEYLAAYLRRKVAASNIFASLGFIYQESMQLQQRLATAESQYDELSRQDNALKNTVKLFYRKHCLNDDSIGWDELGDNLYNALAKTLGDKEFCKWLDTQSM